MREQQPGGAPKTELRVADVYTSNFRRIFAFMSARVPNRETARELAQEVFVRLMETNPSPSTIKEKISSYLYGIARNVIAAHLSTGEPLARADGIEALDKISAVVEQKPFDSNRLEKCLKRQKSTDQEILTLRFWKGESHIEIARHLGMTHDQVRQRFRRALVRLKECLNSREVSHFRPLA
jgi:RNA polymerase sigma-70 factor (ECF subfamily)